MLLARTIPRRRPNVELLSIIATLAVLFTTFAWPQPAIAAPLEGDPIRISLQVSDDSGVSMTYPGAVCFWIDTGGATGAFRDCWDRTKERFSYTRVFLAPAPGYDWSTAATIEFDTTGCGATLGHYGGPTFDSERGEYVVDFGIRTSCPIDPPAPPLPAPGDPLGISLQVYDVSGDAIAYSGEICFRIETGGSGGALDSCVYSTTTDRIVWTGYSVPPSGHVWSLAPTIVSDTTGCGATIGYESGPNDFEATGTYWMGFGIRTSCPADSPPPPKTPTPTPTPTPDPMVTPTPDVLATVTPTPDATTSPTSDPGESVTNSFTLLTAVRACADQRFTATWAGAGVTGMEFSLTNTSDSWTSGWLTADPAAGSFSAPVDHHAYDKVMARATFADGTTAQQDADVGLCSTTSTENPVVPTANSGGGSALSVSSLPSTGVGFGEGFVWASFILLTIGGLLSIVMLWARAIIRR